MIEEAKLSLDESQECLLDANAMLEKERWKASVSRSYYVMYHAAKAILISKNIQTFTHQGVNIQFGKFFIKTGVFDKSLIRAFSKMLDARQKADYEIGFRAKEDDALYAFSEAQFFYNRMKEYLNKL